MDSFVALDIETTGLDPEKEAIIEIGAIRFNDRGIENKWESLINPGRRVPPFITQLTGITDQILIQAPAFHEVIGDLVKFIGNLPIIGHNISFDLGFFKRHGVFPHNEAIDTYETAAILLPTASRYNLGALAQALGVPYPAKHRAMADAQATAALYQRLYREALSLPLPLLAEIIRLSENLNWSGNGLFRRAIATRSREIVSPESIKHFYQGPLFENFNPIFNAPLNPKVNLASLDVDEISALMEPGGTFARKFTQYEYRPQQVDMLRSVALALSNQHHLMVEAGTGTGKSMAYLIPAAIWSIQNNQRVVISTNTINLQDQLINKDIPDLVNALGINVQAVVIKGRSNYFCPRRFEIMRRRGPENVDELRVLAKVLVWLQGTTSGDRSELNLNSGAERSLWLRISAEDEACSTDTCLKKTGGLCPFYRIRQSAQSSHLLIVNHALLLADVATGNRVLPEYDYLIIDEAHHIESATTNALSFKVTQVDTVRLLRELGSSSSGLLGWLLEAAQEKINPSDYARLHKLIENITNHAFQFEHLMRNFFASLDFFLQEQRQGQEIGMYAHQERIVPSTRSQPSWEDVEIAWDEAQRPLKHLLNDYNLILKGLVEILEILSENDQELFSSLSNNFRRLDELSSNINAIIFTPSHDQIYWAEIQSNGTTLSIHAAPLHIGALMEKYIWYEKSSVILTSATLSATGDFDYLRGRLNAVDTDELILGSPFDYETSALLYLVNDIPEPNDRNAYQHAVEVGLINLCRATGGKTLVLFTSYDQLKRTSKAITPILAKHDILVYEQGEGASPHSLLETFRSSERAVLLGTRAFWEGIDIPGEPLSVLVIVKLPFDVPSEPIIAARSETFEDPFNEYSLPEAILRFRQGFGRLIRTQSDRGVVVVFDRRLLTKRYGRLFIESLPQCTIQIGSLSNLPRFASQWINI